MTTNDEEILGVTPPDSEVVDPGPLIRALYPPPPDGPGTQEFRIADTGALDPGQYQTKLNRIMAVPVGGTATVETPAIIIGQIERWVIDKWEQVPPNWANVEEGLFRIYGTMFRLFLDILEQRGRRRRRRRPR